MAYPWMINVMGGSFHWGPPTAQRGVLADLACRLPLKESGLKTFTDHTTPHKCNDDPR